MQLRGAGERVIRLPGAEKATKEGRGSVGGVEATGKGKEGKGVQAPQAEAVGG